MFSTCRVCVKGVHQLICRWVKFLILAFLSKEVTIVSLIKKIHKNYETQSNRKVTFLEHQIV